MSTEHTPGPWKLGQFEWAVDDAEGHHVATVMGPHPEGLGKGITILEANARLIAAAPDLLAACQALLAQSDAYLDYAEDEEMGGAAEQARAAIARAVGADVFTDHVEGANRDWQ